MTRVLSGALLVILAIGIVWFAPEWLVFASALVLAFLAVKEMVALAHASQLDVSMIAAGFATAVVIGSNRPPDVTDVSLMTALIAICAVSLGSWRGGPQALASASASIFPALYIGLPISAMISVRRIGGPPALFLLMLTVMVSDTAQYYTGRAFGRRQLAPAVSPKKTTEGAVGGLVFGTALFAIAGHWWLPGSSAAFRVLLGVALVALGIAGDLFESMLKRSAGIKDSSALIPGHGGVLDRIDALLFAAPIYYIVLKYV
jgi:phosphatidate cytidylyltransferase